MNNKYTTAEKIELANAYFKEFQTGEALPMWLRMREREIEKMNPDNSDLSDFAIPLSDTPEQHYKLMQSMYWVDSDTGEPLINNLGTKTPLLYIEKWSRKQGVTEVKYFISTYDYFLLMLIEQELKDRYKAA